MIRRSIRKYFPWLADALSLLKRRYILRLKRPRWDRILKREANGAAGTDSSVVNKKKKILFATSIGSHLPGTSLDSLLVQALSLRGAEVHVFLCDTFLPACLEGTIERYPQIEKFFRFGQRKDVCKDCFEPARKLFQRGGIPVHRYSDSVSSVERSQAEALASRLTVPEMTAFVWQNISVGEHCLAGVLRFLGRGTLSGEAFETEIVRRYFLSALLTAYAMNNHLRQFAPDTVVAHHGIYVPFGLVRDSAVSRGIRFVTWIPSYRKNSFIFSHGDTYHHTLMTEPVDAWEGMVWNSAIEGELMSYLDSRRHGTRDWIWFHEKPEEDADRILAGLGVNASKPCIGLLTNVMWDAQLHYPANAFPGMLPWILESIGYFLKRPDLQLVIRVHPAEIRGNRASRQPVVDEIRRRYPILPPNIFLIEPESRSSTYAVMERCNAVLIYGTKMGVELASLGVPVIVAGEAWVRNKGITWDASSAADYFRHLDLLPFPGKMAPEQIRRARQYAFHFFFRRMIPLSVVRPEKHPRLFSVAITSIDELAPGRNKPLDIVCEGILTGSDFIYPAEKFMRGDPR